MKPQKSKTVCVLLAVFLSFWTWLYTYKYDAWKFWLGLALSVFLFWTFIVPVAITIWAIVDSATKDEKILKNYFK